MAIGPTGSRSLVSVPSGTGGSAAPSRLARALQDAFGFRGRESAPKLELVVSERRSPADADRRQLNLEEAAEQIRRLNPNAPRGSIVNLVV